MIDLSVNFGSLTNVNKTSKVSNPLRTSKPSFTNSFDNIFSQQKDKREYVIEQNKVAYANPLSFESLFGINNSESNTNTEASAFNA